MRVMELSKQEINMLEARKQMFLEIVKGARSSAHLSYIT